MTPTPEERLAKKAYTVEGKIKKGLGAVREVWIVLAAYLHEFHGDRMWEHLGYERFEDWLGAPEIGQKRTKTLGLIQLWEEFVVKRGLDAATLGQLDESKLRLVLPALRREEVDLATALADCEALSSSDLREKYRNQVPAERIPLTECEQCGYMRRPKIEKEAADA